MFTYTPDKLGLIYFRWRESNNPKLNIRIVIGETSGITDT